MAYTRFLLIALALLLMHAHADYLYQAAAPGRAWWTWLDLTTRAPRWPWWADWIPRDGWHVVQAIRNHTGLLGICLLTFFRAQHPVAWRWRGGPLPLWAACIITALSAYALTRAIGFTLFVEVMN